MVCVLQELSVNNSKAWRFRSIAYPSSYFQPFIYSVNIYWQQSISCHLRDTVLDQTKMSSFKKLKVYKGKRKKRGRYPVGVIWMNESMNGYKQIKVTKGKDRKWQWQWWGVTWNGVAREGLPEGRCSGWESAVGDGGHHARVCEEARSGEREQQSRQSAANSLARVCSHPRRATEKAVGQDGLPGAS